MRIMLLGNPQSGKSSLIDAFNGCSHDLIEQQGIYSFSSLSEIKRSQEVVEQLYSKSPDLIINVVDATQLEYQSFLTSQLLECGIPMIVVLTHLDILHGKVNTRYLEKVWGIPVIALKSYHSKDMTQLFTCLANEPAQFKPTPMNLPSHLNFISTLRTREGFLARRYLEGQQSFREFLSKKIDHIQIPDVDLLLLDARYQWVHDIASQALQIEHTKIEKLTSKLDNVLLHRFWGWPIFILVLWVFFSIAIDFGGFIQQMLTNISESFFEHWLSSILQRWHVWDGVQWILVHGLGQGITTMLSFLPVMTFMNLFLSMMESTGYMSRIAFLFERIMRSIGLPGKAFLPLFIGFGCNVPAIMSSRMVDGSQERLLTVLLSPFMSCSARLTIYAVFASLFFPEYGGWVVLSLYLFGVVMAIFTGWILRRFWLTGKATPLMMELPLFQWPNPHKLFRDCVLRLKLFVIRSGKLVVPFCMILGSLQGLIQFQQAHHSWWAQQMWQSWTLFFHPLLAPLGITVDNWPAALSLLTGTMAKEVVVATLNTLYSQMPDVFQQSHVVPLMQHHGYMFRQLLSLPEGVAKIWDAHSSKALMWAFGSPISAYSYLLFILLYVPCISTLAIIRQEVGAFWQKFAFLWSFILAYSVASLFYQIATWTAHPQQTILWIAAMVALWSIIIMLFHHWKPQHVNSH